MYTHTHKVNPPSFGFFLLVQKNPKSWYFMLFFFAQLRNKCVPFSFSSVFINLETHRVYTIYFWKAIPSYQNESRKGINRNQEGRVQHQRIQHPTFNLFYSSFSLILRFILPNKLFSVIKRKKGITVTQQIPHSHQQQAPIISLHFVVSFFLHEHPTIIAQLQPHTHNYTSISTQLPKTTTSIKKPTTPPKNRCFPSFSSKQSSVAARTCSSRQILRHLQPSRRPTRSPAAPSRPSAR